MGDTLKFFAPVYSNAQYLWTDPDNFTSTLQNPVIHNSTTANSGIYQLFFTYNLQLIFISYMNIQIQSSPIPAFQYNINFQNLTFYNQTLYSDSSFWDFGDGNSSSLWEPSHNYNTLGVYNVTLYSFNDCGSVSKTEQISITSLNIYDVEKQSIVISPNPSKDIFNVKIPENIKANAYEVMNTDGKKINTGKINPLLSNGKIMIDLSKDSENVYFLKIYSQNKPFIYKLIKI